MAKEQLDRALALMREALELLDQAGALVPAARLSEAEDGLIREIELRCHARESKADNDH